MGSVGCRQMNMAADVRPAWLPFQISQSRIWSEHNIGNHLPTSTSSPAK